MGASNQNIKKYHQNESDFIQAMKQTKKRNPRIISSIETLKFPYNITGYLVAFLKNQSKCYGTAVLIHQYFALTAAHVVLDENYQLAEEAVLYLAKNKNSSIKYEVKKIFVNLQKIKEQVKLKRKNRFDYALIRIEPMDGEAKYRRKQKLMKILSQSNITPYLQQEETEIGIIGYPFDLNKENQFISQYESKTKMFFQGDHLILYDLFTGEGQSGGPVIVYGKDHEPLLMALHKGRNTSLNLQFGIHFQWMKKDLNEWSMKITGRKVIQDEEENYDELLEYIYKQYVQEGSIELSIGFIYICIVSRELNNQILIKIEVIDLDSLTSLNLQNNRIDTDGVHIFTKRKYPALKQLYLYWNLIDEMAFNFKNIQALEILTLGLNSIKEIPREIRYLTNLKRLSLENNKIVIIAEELKELKDLLDLNLSMTSMSNSIATNDIIWNDYFPLADYFRKNIKKFKQ